MELMNIGDKKTRQNNIAFVYGKRAIKSVCSNKNVFLSQIISSFAILLLAFFTIKVTKEEFDQFYVNAENSLQLELTEANDVIISRDESVKLEYSSSKSKLIEEDVRVYVLNEYFKSRNSPLVGEAHHFVYYCDYYGAPKDCISVAAIARHETDLCKYHTSYDEKNCWGWGGPPGYRYKFDSIEQGIETATRVLVQQYGNYYMINPAEMEDVFCGPGPECIGWGFRVSQIMREMDDFSYALGVGRLTDFNQPVFRY
ncbi:MAG: hypothetical protein Q9M91_07445 [Candidatus Dojkabacteria bacterium]|nr:hypothetical protein [Candidatus Dojkabacteria bacterium]MDQ7021621.1 hypothetical protein [Candidatus Dojkabacteria bacterium]